MIDDGNASPPGSDRGAKSVSTKDFRHHSNLLGIPYLCNRTACRRAGRCRGTNDACLRRYFPAVPEGARLWVMMLSYLTRELEYPFEEALAKALEMEEAEIYVGWMESIGAWKLGRNFHRVP